MKHLAIVPLVALLAVSCGRPDCCSGGQAACADSCSCSCAAASSDSAAVVRTILARRSVRQYLPEAVRRDQMDVILNCGINAPSGMNRQPWALRVADNAEFLDACTSAWKESLPADRLAAVEADSTFRNMFRNAPTVVFIGAPQGWGDLDCGMLGENMMIAARAMGIGSCCLGGLVPFMNSDAAAPYMERIALPEGYRLVYAIAFGYPAESPDAKPRDASLVRYVE